MTNTIVYLQKSTRKDKKYMVTIINNQGGRNKTIHFGADGYSDFTKHKDNERMKRYDSRHKKREDWTQSGIKTAGFWSKWILWSKPSLTAAKAYTSKKFNITIKGGKPPKKSPKKSPCKSNQVRSSETGRCRKKSHKRKSK